MVLNEALITEIQYESGSTEKVFERIPDDKFDWQPHPKSWTLGQLASHIAEVNSWVSSIIEVAELDFAANSDYKPLNATTKQELLDAHRKNTQEAIEVLKKTDDATLMAIWKMRTGDMIHLEAPRMVALRSTVLNHLYHHRGQLTVYLRMNDAPLPPIYGPTADEQSI